MRPPRGRSGSTQVRSSRPATPPSRKSVKGHDHDAHRLDPHCNN
jgi:hypothetical protein